jgi:SAM-dependent methyltransferase
MKEHKHATNSYYNSIAEEYNLLMEQTPANKLAREAMKEYFLAKVKPGIVLDFGGGTGADLKWMCDAGYSIYFCEPSEGMRARAEELSREISDRTPVFLDNEKTDFTKWNLEKPFKTEADAVLANFAVLNCIDDIDLLFRKLSQVMKPGAQLMALVLERSAKTLVRHYLKNVLSSLILGRPLMIGVHHKKESFSAYLYTTSRIRNASVSYFEFVQNQRLENTPFSLLHLVRK